MSTLLAYRAPEQDYAVLALHEYRPGVALVSTATHGGGEPWRHFVALDRLVIQEKP